MALEDRVEEFIKRLREFRKRKGSETKDLEKLVVIEDKDKKPQPAPSPPPQDKNESSKSHGAVASLLMFIIGVSIFSYIYWATPLGNIIQFFLKDVLGKYITDPSLLDWIVTFLPGYFIGGIFVVYLVISVKRGGVDLSFLPRFFYGIGVSYFIFAVIFGFIYIGYVNVLSTGVFDQQLCSGWIPLTIINQVDQRTADRCMNMKQAVPTYDKIGISTLAQEQLGGLTGTVPTIFPDETYTLPFTVKNLDTKNYLTGVYVEGKMTGQIKSGGQLQDKLIRFTPSSCTKNDPCDILPGGTQVVSLESQESISFYAPSFTDITIYTVYPYTGFGKGEIFESSSETNAAGIDFSKYKPQSDPGPVDVVVHFAPPYFISLATGGKLDHVKMFVDIINNGQGNIDAKSMLIKRIGTFADLGLASCTVHDFKGTFSEGTTQEFQNLEFQKGESVQFICDLPIYKSSGPVPEFRGIVFTATFEYYYRDITPTSLPVRAV